MTLPDWLSLSRVGLAALSFGAIYGGYWRLAAVAVTLAIVTDVLDGLLARRRNQVTAIGGLLDHLSDAVFVTATLSGLAARSIVPAVLPVLVVLAFAQYMLDSRALSGQPLRTSRLGRYNGIAYYVLAALPPMQYALGLHPIPEDWFLSIGWLLALTTLASMADRLIAFVRMRRRAPPDVR